MTRDQVFLQARTWLGSPYKHMGRSKTAGVDCVGIVIGVASELGYEIEAPTRYTTAPSGDMLVEHCEKSLRRQERDIEAIRQGNLASLKQGDICLFWGFTRQMAQHFCFVGDLGSRKTMLHAWSKHGQVVEHGMHAEWGRRVMAVYAYPQLED